MAEDKYDGNLTLEMPPELYRSAELYAVKHGISLDTVIEHALIQYFDQHE
jgi:predicted HicB family RNase H-like nuclease